MKKRFFQVGWVFWVNIALILVVFGLGAIYAIYLIIDPATMLSSSETLHPLRSSKIWHWFVAAFPMILASLSLIQIVSYTVVLTDEEIYTHGHILWRKLCSKIQYPVNIKYSEINKLGLLYTTRDSRGKKYTSSLRGAPQCLFLQVYTTRKKGPTNILIELFSIKQRKQIVELISNYANLDVTYEQLLPNKK